MQTRRNAMLNQPVLIPIAGNYDRKPRSLDREVTTVGRARGSDLCLEANEISTLHCILYRTAEGYRIRDCNSRCGTRINGESVKTGRLHDGDIINVGPFSFEFHMPAALFPNEGTRLDPLRVEHWKESRRRLAQLALKMRKRLQGTSPRELEGVQKGHLLEERIRCYDQRLRELEATEEELAEERRKLARETESHRGHVQTVEQQLADRLAQADEEIHQRWQEFQQRCQAEEARIANASPAQSAAPAEHVERELLRELEAQYQHRLEQLQRDQQEFATMKEQWVSDQNKLSTGMQEEQAVLAQRKADLVRMMVDLKKMQENLRQQAKLGGRAAREEVERLRRENAVLRAHFETNANGTETQAILDENEQLRMRVQQLEASAGQASGNEVGHPQVDLPAEVELLREELQRKDSMLAELSKPEGGGGDSLRAENVLLKQLLEEKNRFVEESLLKSQQAPKTASDLERYEAELNDFRRQLETDRTELNAEVEMLRDRNKELDEAFREMEMEMSKERAELARERMRLERVREEVKADTERLQRELAVRDSMAPVQKLRDELAQKQAPGGKAEKPINDRLRGMRNQQTDGPSGS